MTELERLRVVIEAETKPLQEELNRVKNSLGGLEKETKQTTSKIQTSFSKTASHIRKTLGKALAIAGLVKFGSAAIKMASDLEETQNVVDVAFGEMSYKADEFAKTAIQSTGMSEVSAKKIASTHMAMARGMQVPLESASNMSIALAQMSGDLASFFNTSTEVADTALRGIWTGETEALKKYGVVMTQANLQQWAMNNGITANIASLSQADQAALRYAFVMDTLNYVSGDFARNSSSWANQTRILSEQFKQLSGIIGGWLIKALTPLIQFLNLAIGKFIQLANVINNVFGKLFGWTTKQAKTQGAQVGGQDAITSSIGDTAAAYDDAGNAAVKAAKKAKNALAGFDQLNVLPEENANNQGEGSGAPGGISGLGIEIPPIITPEIPEVDTSALESKLMSAFGRVGEWIKTNFGDIWDDFVPKAEFQLERTKTLAQQIWTDLQTLGPPLKNWFDGPFIELLRTSLDTVSNVFTGLWDSLNTIFADLWDIVIFPFAENFAETWLPAITENITYLIDNFNTLFDEVKEIFDMIWKDAIAPALEVIMDMWTDFSNDMKASWDKYGAPIYEAINEAIESVGEILQQVWTDYLKPIWDFVIEKVKKVWDEAIRPFVNDFRDGFAEISLAVMTFWNEKIAPLISWFLHVMKPVFDQVWGSVSKIVSGAVDTIIGVIDGVRRTFRGIVDFIAGIFTGDWRRAWDGVKNIFGGIWDGIKSIVSGAWDFILGLFSNTGKIFKGVVGAIGDVFKKIVNSLIGGINKVIATPFNVINGLLNKIKDISILGMKPFSGFWGYNPLPVPQIPKLATGTNYIQREGLAYLHEGEAVVPKKYNPALGGGNNKEQIALLVEQNKLLTAILNKETDIRLDGQKVNQTLSKADYRRQRSLGLAR